MLFISGNIRYIKPILHIYNRIKYIALYNCIEALVATDMFTFHITISGFAETFSPSSLRGCLSFSFAFKKRK